MPHFSYRIEKCGRAVYNCCCGDFDLQSGFLSRKQGKIRQNKLFLLRWSVVHLTQLVLTTSLYHIKF